jgi:hypothetical protein
MRVNAIFSVDDLSGKTAAGGGAHADFNWVGGGKVPAPHPVKFYEPQS